jgi:outer membrane protein TolC
MPHLAKATFRPAVRGLQGLAVLLALAFFLPAYAAKTPAARTTRDTGAAPSAAVQAAGEKAEADIGVYLKETAEKNARLKAAFQRIQAALERIPQDKSLPDPRFTFGYFIVPVETRVGPQNARLGLTQTLPWIGKLIAKGDAAAALADAEKARFDALRLSLFYEVKKTYFEYAYLLRAMALTKENRDLLDYLEGVIKARYTANMAGYGDLLGIQMERDKLDERYRSQEDLRHPLAAALNAVMNRPVEAALPDTPDIPVMQVGLDDAKLLAALNDRNPQLKVYDYQAKKEKIGGELARMDFIPDLTFGIETIITGPYSYYVSRYDASSQKMTSPTPPPRDSGKDAWIGSVSLNIPLWIGKRQAAIREAKARETAAVADREGLSEKLSADLKLALYNYRDAARKIELYQNVLIPKAQQALAAMLASYQAGRAGFADLVNTQRSLLEFELNHIRALATQAQRLAEIDMLVGEDVPYTVYGSLQALSAYAPPVK